MFKLLLDKKEYTFKNYEEFCKDLKFWDTMPEKTKFNGTGGDWRYIGLTLHNAVSQALEDGKRGIWLGIYVPYSVPPIGFFLG